VRAGPLTLALAVLLPVCIVALYASLGTSGRHGTVPPPPQFGTHAPRQPKPDEPGRSGAEGAAALAAGIAAGVVGLGAWAVWRRRRGPGTSDDARAAVAAGAREARAAAAIPADPRAAVLAAYARMEAALAGVGLARRASEARVPGAARGRARRWPRAGRAPDRALRARALQPPPRRRGPARRRHRGAAVAADRARGAGVNAVLAVAAVLVAAGAVRALRAALPASRPVAAARGAPPGGGSGDLARLGRAVATASAHAGELHMRLRPVLREVAADALHRRGIDLDREPGAARALLAEDTWEIVRPDRPPPADAFAAGLPAARLEAVIDDLEELAR
jgi:hypothetical protein